MESAENAPPPGLSPPLANGPWQGWSTWTGSEPFEEYIGPFYARRDARGAMETGFDLAPRNMNGAGGAHGGALMSFADYSLFMIAIDHIGGVDAVTVSFACEFVGNVAVGTRPTCRGDVIKAGRSLIFVRGLIEFEGSPILNFSGTIKILRPRPIS